MFLTGRHCESVVSPTAFIVVGMKMIGIITIIYINTPKIKSIVLAPCVQPKLVIRVTVATNARIIADLSIIVVLICAE
jgi:hypothetical protein